MIPFWKKTGKDGKKKPQKPAVPRTAQQRSEEHTSELQSH